MTTILPPNRLIFDTFCLDFDAGSIRSAAGVIPVEPQVFDLIAMLCTNAGRLVSHDEIIEKVWHGRIVSDSTIATRVSAARKALGDDGTAQRIIKTVRGRGFRFELLPTEAPAYGIAAVVAPPKERFVLSVTPHGFALLMRNRSRGSREDWRAALPKIFAESVATSGGAVVAADLAEFERGSDAVSCAYDLRCSVDRHCEALSRDDRWTVKIGLSCGTVHHGFAHALAGRLSALAEPGGICLTRRVRDDIGSTVELTCSAVNESSLGEGNDAFKVSLIRDINIVRPNRNHTHQLINFDIAEPAEVSAIVLPFEIIGNDPDLAAMAIGLRMEVHNAFAQISGVATLAYGTQSAFAGKTSPEAADALGVRYVLQGSLRSVDRQARIMLELYDHRKGSVIWTHAYDGSLDGGFDVQHNLTRRIVREMDVRVLSGEQARIWHKEIGSWKGLLYYYNGLRYFFQMTRAGFQDSRNSFHRLRELHPDVALAPTLLAFVPFFEAQRGWTDDVRTTIDEIKHWARIAIEMPDSDGQAHTALCYAHILDREYQEALEIGELNIAVRPSCVNANAFYANALYYCGVLDKAIYHVRLAIRLSPAYPAWFATILAAALHAHGDHEAAIAVAREAVRLNPNDGHAKLVLCSALFATGREAEATAVGVELKRMEPDFLPIPFLNRLPFKNDAMRAQLTVNCSRAILNAE